MIMDIVINILEKTYNEISMLASFTDRSPFQILIATALSARSRDEQIIGVVEKLFKKYPSPEKMAKANLATLEKYVRKSGFYKIKAKRIRDISQRLVSEFGGEVPKTMNELLSLPGVGRKTAGCVLVYAFRIPAIPVDTHVHRVSNRLGWVNTKDPLRTEQSLMKLIPKSRWLLINELLVIHGKNICKPQTPMCNKCTIEKYCAKKF